MSDPNPSAADPFGQIADEFVAAFRQGKQPSVEEFAQRYPEHAAEIRDMLPALALMEQAKSAADPSEQPRQAKASAAAVPLQQLGDYRILREVGRGGMGVVYEAQQLSLGRHVAIKVLPAHALLDPRHLGRFQREARSAARLHHTNIVPVFGVGEQEGLHYFVMQFIPGLGLDVVLVELRRLRHAPSPLSPAAQRAAMSFALLAGERGRGEEAGKQAPTPGDAPGRPTNVTRDVSAVDVARGLLSGEFRLPGGTDLKSVLPEPAGERTLALGEASPVASAPGSPRSSSAVRAADTSATIHLPGQSEGSTLTDSGNQYWQSVARIGLQVADALAHAASQGVLHRDIKPSNLLLDDTGNVWVTDFGLAKAVSDSDDLTHTGEVVGTLRYMAPERFNGQGDLRSDVYSLGLTLYEMVVLRPAFDEADRNRLVKQVMYDEPVRPRKLNSSVPRDLETVVLKAIARDPAHRYQTPAEMAADLKRFVEDRPVHARRISGTEKLWRWCRRNPLPASLVAGMVLVFLAGFVGVFWQWREAEGARADEKSQRDRAEQSQKQALLERDRSRQLSADLALDKGVALAEAGHADRGLLWMLEALKTAPEDAEAFKRMIRWNLGAWLGQVHKPLRFIDVGGSWNYCSFSPDGKSFATGKTIIPNSISVPISLWNTGSGRKLFTLPDAFAPCAFRPDGKALIAYADQSRMIAIEPASGRVLWTTPPLPGQWAHTIDFSADGGTVLAQRFDDAGSAWLYRLNAVTGKECAEPMRGWGRIAVAPGGQLAAAGRIENGDAYIDLVDLPSGRRTGSLLAGAPALHQFVFSPDRKSLYVSAREGDVSKGSSFFGRIWAMGGQRATSPLLAQTGSGAYAPSADRLVTATEDLLVVRDPKGRAMGSGFPLRYVDGSDLIPQGLDGRTMLAVASDLHVGLWQISAEAEPVPDKQAAPTRSASSTRWRGFNVFVTDLRADGQIAVSLSIDAAGREQVRLSDPASGRPLGTPASHHPGWIVRALAFSPDGRYFATGSNPLNAATGELRLWDTSTGRLLLPPIPHTNFVSAIAFHPDGKLVATGEFSAHVRIWDISTGCEIGRPLPTGEIVLALSFSPDGQTLAVGLANDRTGKAGTRLWDITTRQPIGELLPSTDRITRIEFRPDGRALLAGTIQSTRLWDTIRGEALTEPLIDEVTGGFRHDGRAFRTVGGDGSVKVRDATTGDALSRFRTSSSPAKCAAFLGDDSLIAAGFEDGTVRLYDPATNQPVGPPRFMRHAVVRVAFMSDGRSVAAVHELGETRTWPVRESLDGNLDDLTLRIEARTGLRMDKGLAMSRLSAAAWQERLDQLARLDPNAAGPDSDPAWHAPLIREAEQDGNTFAAIWHLDRLIATRPDVGRIGNPSYCDWFLYARRGRACSLSDQLDKAAFDFEKAERLASREQVLDFQTHCALDCTRAERWAAALWYLDRLIAAHPKDWSLHLDRAAVYGKLSRDADRQAEMARVFELGADEGVVIPRAEELGRAGRWGEAARLLAGCARRGPLSHQVAQAWAIACLQAKDYAGYREVCALDLACQGSDPTVIWGAASAAVLFAMGPKGLDDYRVPIAWFEIRLSGTPSGTPIVRRVLLNVLGGLLLRAGRLDEAIARVHEGIAATKELEMPSDWGYLALAHARKGNLVEARQMLDRLRAWRPDSSTDFWDLQEVILLRSEAEALVGSGKAEPKK
jgi:serine/threonine protein kinase/WD40 repeat protein/tetratricopeptide (TPR) repeat protein